MTRNKSTLKNILEKPSEPSKSILNLLYELQNKEYQGKKGLRQYHFRYALIESPGLDKHYTERRLNDFFGEGGVDFLVNSGKIKKGYINTRQSLNYHLLKLEEIGAITSKGKRKKARYFINPRLEKEKLRIFNKKAIDSYSSDHILDLSNGPQSMTKIVIYGVPQSIINNEKENISNHLKSIENKIQEVESIVRREIIDDKNKRIKSFLKNIKNPKITEVVKSESPNFERFFDTNIIDNLQNLIFEKFEKKIIKALKKEHDRYNNYWTPPYPKIKYDRALKGFYRKSLDFFDKPITPSSIKKIHFSQIRLFERGGCTKEEITFYTKLFSKKYFLKDYKLTLNEIKEILNFITSNPNCFSFSPGSIMLSRFKLTNRDLQR